MRSSKPLYDILGVYIPLSILILWAPLPGIVYRLFTPASSGPAFSEILWCLAGFLSALAASCYAVLIKKSMIRHGAADLRGGIIAAAASYAFLSIVMCNSSVMRNTSPVYESFVRCFLPSVNAIAAALAAFFAWFSVISLRETFGGLELFESFTARCRGEQLRESMREYAPEMSQTDSRLKRLMVSYALQFIVPCLLMMALGILRVSLPLTALVIILFCAGFLLLGFLGLLRRELTCASEGISLTVRDRSLPLPVMALGTGIAAVLALAGSSDTSLLPPEIILGFFALLLRLFSLLFRPRAVADFSSPGRMSGPGRNLAELFPQTGETGPWPGWKWIKYGVIALAAFLFLLFMIHPLLRRSGFSPRVAKIRAAVAGWFGDLKKGISALFAAIFGGRALRDRMKNHRPDAEKLRRIASELLSGTLNRKEVKHIVNLFARLILWGTETLAVPWKPSIAPGEYCGLLAAAFRVRQAVSADTNEEIPKAIGRSGELFEKALYSLRHLSREEEQDFRRMVESITGIPR